MTDRGALFLFSLLMVVAGMGTAGWLFATGQDGSVDGLFLLLTSLLVALVFGMYLVFLVRRAMETLKSSPQTAKAEAAQATAKPESAPVSR